MPAGFLLSFVEVVKVIGIEYGKFLELVQIRYFEHAASQRGNACLVELRDCAADMWLSHA